MMKELLDPAGKLPYTHIYVPVGFGATIAGILIAKKMYKIDKLIVTGINVYDRTEFARRRIDDMISEFNKRSGTNYAAGEYALLDSYLGMGPYSTTPESLAWVKRMTKLEGILLDPYFTGKAFHGLMDQISKKKISVNDSVLFIHTGGVLGLIGNMHLFNESQSDPHSAVPESNKNERVN